MFNLPPGVRTPTREQLQKHAAELCLTLSEDELDHFSKRASGFLSSMKRLDRFVEPPLEEITTPRDPGYRPEADENPLNAFITRCDIQGAEEGPLDGYTVGLKDNVSVAGVPLTNGSKLFEGYVPVHDATVVTRILEAGGRITGKLNMEAMAFSGGGDLFATGPVLNPRDDDYLAGGSSSGSAAAVVAGEVDVAIGTDQAGSVRIPASWCGCVGLKPTFGRVPYPAMDRCRSIMRDH